LRHEIFSPLNTPIAILHLSRWLLDCSLTVRKLQPRLKSANISYLRVLFHNSKLLLTFWYINNKKSKEKNTFILQFTYMPSLWIYLYGSNLLPQRCHHTMYVVGMYHWVITIYGTFPEVLIPLITEKNNTVHDANKHKTSCHLR
jgi:hypothetical protein